MTRFQTRNPTRLLVALSVLILLLTAPLICTGISIEPQVAKPLRVLFIGNSLTYSNDLPAIIEAFAKNTGQRFTSRTIAFPDFSLEDHWNKGDARKAILKGGWDFVVMQQGPSASKEGRTMLIEYSRRFAEEIRKSGGKPVLYSVWPSRSRIQDFKGVSESHRLAAEAVGGIVFPVGDAWLNAWRVSPSIGLYAADAFHPSSTGSYLAGLVIYEKLYNQSPVGLPSELKLSSGARIKIPADHALLLQHAAAEANKLHGLR